MSSDYTLKELVSKGKSQGYLTKLEVLERIPSTIIDEEQINIILAMIEDMGIKIKDTQ